MHQSLFSQGIYIMGSSPSCVNVYGVRIHILELSDSVKGKTRCLFTWNLKFVTRYQTRHLWNTNDGPCSDQSRLWSWWSHTPRWGFGRCILLLLVSLLINPTACNPSDVNIIQTWIVLDLFIWRLAQDPQNLRLKLVNIIVFHKVSQAALLLNSSKVLYQLELLAYFQIRFYERRNEGFI